MTMMVATWHSAVKRLPKCWYLCQNTVEELRERFNKHRHETENRRDNNEPSAHIHKYQHGVLTLKRNIHQKQER